MAAIVGDEPALAHHLESLEGLEDSARCGRLALDRVPVAQIEGLFGYWGPTDMMEGARRAA